MAGIYISWPFCAQKCTYCNFASGVLPRELEARYPEALRREIAAWKFAWEPRTVYLGGGTPSLVDASTLAAILNALPGHPWAEATIEAAPGSFPAERVMGWVGAGLNRVSLGVQSFVKGELLRTGRRHDAATVRGDVAVLRAAGIDNINIDLIAGLPSQTMESWHESLEATIALGVPHVSVYMLEVDEDSRLGTEILLGGKRYGASDVPSDDQIGDFYEYAVERLATAGILRYEISNFARPGSESLHNMKYWRREPYVGFGADAHSFDGTTRWRNPESVPDYLARAGSEKLDAVPADPMEEKFFVGLRLSEGVEPVAGDWQRFGAIFERFLKEGLLERAGNRLRLTPRGVMVSNEIFGEFVSL